MGRWTERYGDSVSVKGGWTSTHVAEAHNADCDTYEAKIAEMKARIKSQRSRIYQLTHGMADERKANSKLLSIIDQLKEWNAEALAENNRLDAYSDALAAELACVTTERDALAKRINHDGTPVDIAALCVEIDEVAAELARVKAESLRVVKDGPVVSYLKCETVTMLLDGDLVAHDENGHCVYLLKTEDIAHISANRKVQPVRLERWEEEG